MEDLEQEERDYLKASGAGELYSLASGQEEEWIPIEDQVQRTMLKGKYAIKVAAVPKVEVNIAASFNVQYVCALLCMEPMEFVTSFYKAEKSDANNFVLVNKIQSLSTAVFNRDEPVFIQAAAGDDKTFHEFHVDSIKGKIYLDDAGHPMGDLQIHLFGPMNCRHIFESCLDDEGVFDCKMNIPAVKQPSLF